MKRAITLAIYGITILAVVWVIAPSWFRRPKHEEAQIQTAPATYREIEQLVQSIGEVVASKATDIRSEVSGRVGVLHVKPGDRVNGGQVLLELDRAELESEEQEATFRVDASKLRLGKAKLDYDRKAQLRSRQFVMEKELEDAKTELDLATNAVEIDGARLQTIKEKLVKSVIRAPHDGTILNLRVREGVVISGANIAGAEATLLMQVADLSQLQVLAELNEVDVIKIQVGSPATVTFDSVPGLTVNGTVNYVSPSAVAKEKDKTVRVFGMSVTLAPTDEQVKPGITARVTISTARNPRALAVSLGAVFVEDYKPCVFVKDGSGFQRRQVVLGINDSAWIEVRDGLKEGEAVALQHPPSGQISGS